MKRTAAEVMHDVCGCGDWRKHHPSDGKCRVCGDSKAPADGCQRFSLVKECRMTFTSGTVKVTDDMRFGAAVGWRMAHDEICNMGDRCSAHQPIEAAARKNYLVAALLTALLTRTPLPLTPSGAES